MEEKNGKGLRYFVLFLFISGVMAFPDGICGEEDAGFLSVASDCMSLSARVPHTAGADTASMSIHDAHVINMVPSRLFSGMTPVCWCKFA